MEQLAPDAPDLKATSEAHPAPQSWMLWAVAVVWAGVVTGSLVLTLASDQLDQRGLRAFLTAWIVVPYAASGMVAWWRRPASRLGPLMLATGLAMALSPLQWSSQPVVHSVGELLDMLPVALFLHVFLAFPTGRLTRRSERLTVVACYATVLGLQVVKVALGVDPASVFTLVHRPGLANVVEAIQLSLVAALLLVGALILQLRRRRAGPWLRRPSALVADAFNLALVTLAALFLADLGVLPGARGDPARHLRLARAGADRVPRGAARRPAGPRRRGGAGRRAAGRPDDRPAGCPQAGAARPRPAAEVLAARARHVGGPGRPAVAPR